MTPLSVVIPSFNESATINTIVEKVATQKQFVRQIILVNDGSSDNTRSVMDTLEKNWNDPTIQLTVIHFERNHGKGAAVRAGVDAATQPYFLIQDADTELDPNDYTALVDPIEKKRSSIVFGNRFPKGFPNTIGPLSRLANWIVTHLSNYLYRMRLQDQACGYKLLPTSLLRDFMLESDGFEICSEMTAKIGRRHLLVVNVPVRYTPRNQQQGKKIRWMDGFIAVYTLLRYRL